MWPEFDTNKEAIKDLSEEKLGPYKTMSFYENGLK
jgi:hypothetical protein